MMTWNCHIDLFEQHYDKAFAGERLFGAEIMDKIHRWVQVFLNLCDMTSLDGVDTGALS